MDPLTVKIITVGEASVGKTCLINRIVYDQFNADEAPTLGFLSFDKQVEYENSHMVLRFFDTAGQEKYNSVTQIYFKGCDLALLVYDTSRAETLEKLNKWNKILNDNDIYGSQIIVVGTKIDLENREVTTPEGEQYAKQIGARFIEVSSCCGINIEGIISEICKLGYHKLTEGNVENNQIVERRDKEGCGC